MSYETTYAKRRLKELDTGVPEAHAGERASLEHLLGVTVKKVDLAGNVLDTFATETEHNGIRAEQAPLFDIGRPVQKVPENQGKLL